jgi:hypothetical protein
MQVVATLLQPSVVYSPPWVKILYCWPMHCNKSLAPLHYPCQKFKFRCGEPDSRGNRKVPSLSTLGKGITPAWLVYNVQAQESNLCSGNSVLCLEILSMESPWIFLQCTVWTVHKRNIKCVKMLVAYNTIYVETGIELCRKNLKTAWLFCYHEDGSKKLNACNRFFLRMVYF